MAEITPRQLRAARALLGWSQEELADRAVVARATVQRIERGLAVRTDVYFKVCRTLESAGIDFLPGRPGGKGEGVRLATAEL